MMGIPTRYQPLPRCARDLRSIVTVTCVGATLVLTAACSSGSSTMSHPQESSQSSTPRHVAKAQPKGSSNAQFTPVTRSEGQKLLSGSRVVIGTVKSIQGGQIKVEYADSLQPRFLPLEQAKEKGMEIKEGDKIKMVFNAEDLLVDFHPLGHAEGHHQVVRGVIEQQMPVGQEHVVIKTANGDTASYPVRPLARSKMASMPVGVDAVFLTDETGKIVDVTFGSPDAVEQASQEYQRMSNPKSPHKQINGMVFDPLDNDKITIETSAGTKWTYPVRPFVHDRISAFKKGQSVTLLVDSDNHVIDVAEFDRAAR